MDVTRDVAPYDESAHPANAEETNPEFEDHVEHGREVYARALSGLENSLPRNNRMAPTASHILYSDPVNWHPCTVGVNAGTRVNNVRVSYSGGLNVFNKTTLTQ